MRVSTTASASSCVSSATSLVSGWGQRFSNRDDDGNLDLIVEDDHYDDLVERIHDNVTYGEPSLLFHIVMYRDRIFVWTADRAERLNSARKWQ
jgi:hypothetical protein